MRHFFSPKLKFCIYGINYKLEDDEFTFDDKLYLNNDHAFNGTDTSIDEFEMAAKPLCDKIGSVNDQGANLTDYYYGAWVKVSFVQSRNNH